MNKQGNVENLRPHQNKPGQFPLNIPREAVHKKRLSLNHTLRRMLKDSPEKVFEYLGMDPPKRLAGEDKQTHKAVVAALLAKAMSGNTNAINVVLERIEGKAVQPIEMSGPDDKNLVAVEELPLELRVEILRQMLADAERELDDQREQQIKVVSKGDVEVEDGKIIQGEIQPELYDDSWVCAYDGGEGDGNLQQEFGTAEALDTISDGGQGAGGDAEAGAFISGPEVP